MEFEKLKQKEITKTNIIKLVEEDRRIFCFCFSVKA